ncbi:hypothetical protein [Chryseobacterium sp.]|uniref:hypothetical protein n=1 Tax=Chryseobacterium sp. TaxID=1871047 RepID=UPI00321A9F0B
MKYRLFMLFLTAICHHVLPQKNTTEKTNKGNNYTLVYEFPYDGEVLVNDVLADKSIYRVLNGTEFINYFILENGEQTIKAELTANMGSISSESLKKTSSDFGIYNANIENGEVQNIQPIQKLNFPEFKTSVPSIVGEWKFNANLPFKLEGWKNSEDLSKWEKDKLEKEVVKKFNELRDILNAGNSSEFLKQLAFANKEFFIANYYSEERKKEFLSNLSDDFTKQKNLVSPIENYRLRLMGNGKVVALETVSNDSQGILTTKDSKNKTTYVTYIMLHKPHNSESLEVVRYIAYSTGLLNR